MTKILERTVLPSVDKFYVYALFKPNDFNPFYVGKGKGVRVNEHFRPANLVKNTPKTGVIKKYGDQIRREILCYFTKEQDAYDFEEYLIALYGLKSEGGNLVNYAKTRFEYSDAFVEAASGIAHKYRERKYSKELIYDILDHFYRLKVPVHKIIEKFGIHWNYVGYVLRGEKCKYDYLGYMEANPDICANKDNTYKELISISKFSAKNGNIQISDQDLHDAFNNICEGRSTSVIEAERLGTSVNYLLNVFKGRKRQNLSFDFSKYPNSIHGKSLLHLSILNTVEPLLLIGKSVKEISNITGLGRTTIYRVKQSLQPNSA